MQRRRRTDRVYVKQRGNALLTRVLLFLSAVIVLAGLGSRLLGGSEMASTVLSTPSPTPVTAAFDETVGKREARSEAETWYCIQSGIFSTEKAAQEKSNVYAERGAPGYVAQDGEKFRVLLAAYGDKNDAQSVRDRLSSQQGVETYVYELTRPVLHMQLQGMAGQLDVIEAGFALFPNLARQLRDAAIAADQGENDLKALGEVAAAVGEQSRVMRQVLSERFVSPRPDLATRLDNLCALTDAAVTRMQDAQKQGVTAASAQMKMEAIRLFVATVTTWQAILAQ